ncbi:unnamed protein product [Lactuca saligna]|uniref:BHLH domain-containing protein n=1 Tax=Lactuca saligna TaxID=75948 RepID=A0AA36EKH4_LACSI|nr:unnamed protein product [Lactuca saligna]
MGDQDFQQTLGDLLEIKSKCMKDSSRNLLWRKVMEAQVKKTWLGGWKTKIRRCPTRNNTLKMRKRQRVRRAASHRGSRRATTRVIERKVRTLKKLIPNGESSIGLDGLFIETAEYITNLQRRVRIMQAVVDALSCAE